MMFANDDDMIECPYNESHRMLRKRLQSHLLKCRIHYPDVELRKCPFNLSHLIPEPEFTHHVTNCPDRKLITQYKYDAPEAKEEEHPKHAPIESEENWDETDVPDYDPTKYVKKAIVIRRPEGPTPSERKEFIKSERKRLGDVDSEEDDDEDGSVVHIQDVERSERVRSNSPRDYYETSSRKKSPTHRATHNDRTTYNSDDDPYYSHNSKSYNRDGSASRRGAKDKRTYSGEDTDDSRAVQIRKDEGRKRMRSRSPRNRHHHSKARSPEQTYSRDSSPSRSTRNDRRTYNSDNDPYYSGNSRTKRDRSPSRPETNDKRSYNSRGDRYSDDLPQAYRSRSPTNNRGHYSSNMEFYHNMGSGSSDSFRSKKRDLEGTVAEPSENTAADRENPGPRAYFTENYKR